MKKLLALTAIVATLSPLAHAQDVTTTSVTITKPSRIYASSSLDGAMFSLNTTSQSGIKNIVRFSYFINTGVNFNRDFGNHFGMYVGIGVKNLGYIEKSEGVSTPTLTTVPTTVKHRVYAVGIPVGFKFGNLKPKGTFGLIGGGVDFPTNYKEKIFTDGRKNKTKSNEWFSKQVTPVMPYVFLGVTLKSSFTIKLQYYPGNFMNQDYKDNTGALVYAGYESHIGVVSLSYNVKGKSDGQTRQKFKMMMHSKKSKSA